MKLDPKIMKYAREMCPEFDEFIWRDGCLYTVLLKAIYGCIQASALWYAYIRREIEKMGYTASETDRCVFVKQVGNRIFILMLYVDDIMAIYITKDYFICANHYWLQVNNRVVTTPRPYGLGFN
jgi:hypothetical protein